MINKSNSGKENHQIRLFLSSTFKDINEVRSHLAINVFPYTRKKFFKEGINFSWIDLRWGITNEDAQAGLVIPMCLKAINECNIFIGIIGDYYGTTLCRADIEALDLSEEIKHQIINYLDLSNQNDRIDDRISMTEIEIFYGILNDCKIQNSCFFIKENESIEDLRINKLILKIKQGGYTCHSYSSKEQLGRLLTNYLFNYYQTHYGDENEDELHKESMIQKTILESYLDDYHSDEEFEELDWELNRVKWDKDRGFFDYKRFYHGNNHAIVGEWGCGKSSFIANWINRIENTNEYNIVYYFVNSYSSYATPSEIANYLSYMILKLNEYNKIINVSELAKDPVDKLKCLLEITYRFISKPLVIAIDGVENLEDNKESKYLEWIGHVHPYVYFVISAKNNDDSILHFKDLGIEIQECPRLNEGLLRTFIDNYLKQYHKNINDKYLDKITDSSVLKSPLMLRRFLDLLIACDNNNSLENTINKFTVATTKQAFIALYLDKLGTYFPSFYKELLYYLTISKDGLYGCELGALLREGQMLPTKRVVEICVMLDDFIALKGIDNLINTNCKISLKNDVVKEAICNYLIDENVINNYRRKILETINDNQFVRTYVDTIHRYSEILHQLYELKELRRLYDKLLIPDLINRMRNSKDYLKYWTALYERGYSMLGFFQRDLIKNISDDMFVKYATKVLWLAQSIGNYIDSTHLLKTVIDIMANRHLIDVDQNECFHNLSAEIAQLMTIFFEMANENHIICHQIYSLYKPLLQTLESNEYNIEARIYLYYYTYVLYCDFLIVLEGRNQESKIYNLLYNICIKVIRITDGISHEQKQYVIMMANITLLKLASISSQYYSSIIKSVIHESRNILNTALVSSASLSPSTKVRTALFYLFAYRCGMPTIKKDNEYLETAINVLIEVEKDGNVNVNKYLVLCYLGEIRWFSQNNDNEKVEHYKTILFERLYDDNKPKWDLPPYIMKEVEDTFDILHKR